MKILYASDVESDFDKLKILREYSKKSKPDLVVVSGDIIDTAYRDPDTVKNHHGLAQIIFNYATQTEPGLKRLTPYEAVRAIPIIAERICQNPPSEDLEQIAEKYLKSLDFMEWHMDIQYEVAKHLLESIDYRTIPGNHDKNLKNTALKEKDMHKKALEKKGVKIAMFGGANDFKQGDLVPLGTPPELTIPFNEYPDEQGRTMSEIFNFMIKEKPGVAFTHTPPIGLKDLAVHPMIRHSEDPKIRSLLGLGGPALLDYVRKSGNQELMRLLHNGGSPGLMKYLQQGHTRLLCCGHMHESVGADKLDTEKGPVVVFNGGSLKDGYFGEVSFDDNSGRLDKIALYRIKERLILPGYLKETLDVNNASLIMQYFLTPDNELKKMKIDLEDPYDY